MFASAESIFQHLDNLSKSGTTDTVVVGHVSPADFQTLEAELEARGRRFRLFYLAESQMAIITIPTAAHELMHTGLTMHLEATIQQMGALRFWQWTAAATGRASSGSSGQGDTSGSPFGIRSGND